MCFPIAVNNGYQSGLVSRRAFESFGGTPTTSSDVMSRIMPGQRGALGGIRTPNLLIRRERRPTSQSLGRRHRPRSRPHHEPIAPPIKPRSCHDSCHRPTSSRAHGGHSIRACSDALGLGRAVSYAATAHNFAVGIRTAAIRVSPGCRVEGPDHTPSRRPRQGPWRLMRNGEFDQ
jgi:hypothetical protein